MKNIYILIYVLLILVSTINAAQWSSEISAGSSSWNIYRQSQTLNFSSTGSVNGHISPIIYNGNNLTSHSSYYANIKENDVEFRERTSALEGSYQANENLMLISNVSDSDIEIYVSKTPGSDIYTFSYLESWPVLLAVNREINYSGQQIDHRDFEGNNQDFAENNLLYNKVLKKDLKATMLLKDWNATVQATNDSILSANLYPKKFLNYETNISTTGIADLRYRQSSSLFNVGRQTYFSANENRETYYGTFNISRKMKMEMKYYRPSLDDENNKGYEWLSCCYGGWLSDQNSTSIEGDYNYSCILPREKGNNASLWFRKGIDLIESGNYSEAIRAYDQFIDLSPSNATAWNQKGVTLALMGRYNESIDSFKRATDLNPQYATAWYNKGTTLVKVGRYEEAIHDYDMSININPKEPGFWYAKGSALRSLNRKVESEIAFAKAKEIADAAATSAGNGS
jgi:tetratricopeptide (TPR) repeat protein